MITIYASIALCVGLFLLVMVYAIATEGDGSPTDKAALTFFSVNAAICIYAAMDWFNILPEV